MGLAFWRDDSFVGFLQYGSLLALWSVEVREGLSDEHIGAESVTLKNALKLSPTRRHAFAQAVSHATARFEWGSIGKASSEWLTRLVTDPVQRLVIENQRLASFDAASGGTLTSWARPSLLRPTEERVPEAVARRLETVFDFPGFSSCGSTGRVNVRDLFPVI